MCNLLSTLQITESDDDDDDDDDDDVVSCPLLHSSLSLFLHSMSESRVLSMIHLHLWLLLRSWACYSHYVGIMRFHFHHPGPSTPALRRAKLAIGTWGLHGKTSTAAQSLHLVDF